MWEKRQILLIFAICKKQIDEYIMMEDYKKEDLFHDVADKYLKNLEYEIKKVVSEIPYRLLEDISKQL